MLIAILLTLVLVVASIFVHYEMLRLISSAMQKMSGTPRRRLLLAIGVVFVAHIIEISLFAIGFGLMQHRWGLGEISGTIEGGWVDFFYFSASSYTTLGMGDLFPSGDLRFVAAIESLAGLVLIGWSASFTYLSMRDFWRLDEEC
ncbi:hypothetical protein MNBD_ALPHA12-179 [hydrothermal vent metagenome]|uniref:Potassium channel domain-containing protein n=1 Tax=hydrothermal vent metagenome TaxID=652676 RepID=A0A3B0U7B1_9ZZZZ